MKKSGRIKPHIHVKNKTKGVSDTIELNLNKYLIYIVNIFFIGILYIYFILVYIIFI